MHSGDGRTDVSIAAAKYIAAMATLKRTLASLQVSDTAGAVVQQSFEVRLAHAIGHGISGVQHAIELLELGEIYCQRNPGGEGKPATLHR